MFGLDVLSNLICLCCPIHCARHIRHCQTDIITICFHSPKHTIFSQPGHIHSSQCMHTCTDNLGCEYYAQDACMHDAFVTISMYHHNHHPHSASSDRSSNKTAAHVLGVIVIVHSHDLINFPGRPGARGDCRDYSTKPDRSRRLIII